MADIKEAFELYDENGEGFISVRDTANVVRAFGFNPTEHELQAAIAEVDSGSGKLSLPDVTSVISRMKKPDYAAQVREAFKVFDKDGQGSIDIGEIKHILSNLGERMTDEEVADVLKESGLEGKASISCDDFIKIMLASQLNHVSEKKVDGTGVPVSIQGADGGIRAAMFHSSMPPTVYTYNVSLNSWASWDRARAETTWRSYNYPHPTMVLYSLYSLAREAPGLAVSTAAAAAASGGAVTPLQPWQFYLSKACLTVEAMWSLNNGISSYAQYGLMVGSGFGLVMDAAAYEGGLDPSSPYNWTGCAAFIDSMLQQRVALWTSLPFPFGSEMPWDSTGQEEIETWCARYGSYTCSNTTLDSVLAYTPAVPHWAYNGNSRRYFDFGVNGSPLPQYFIDGTERGLHHYGSGINSVATLGAFRRLPNDTHLLEVGMGATLGTLTTIEPGTGVLSMAWHGDASLLVREPYAADGGVNVYGSSRGWGCYVVADGDFGMLGYGCDVTASSGSTTTTTIVPRDALHRALYLAPLGLDLRAITLPWVNATLDMDPSSPSLTLNFDLSGGAGACPGVYGAVRVSVEVPVAADLITIRDLAVAQPSPAPPVVRGAYEMPCSTRSMVLTWAWAAQA